MEQYLAKITRPAHSFKIWQSANKQYYFVYYDGNYQTLVTSETYVTLQGAMRALENFKYEMKRYI